jgi:23S rRNA-/tRNA-specific pseudouridylate synthase
LPALSGSGWTTADLLNLESFGLLFDDPSPHPPAGPPPFGSGHPVREGDISGAMAGRPAADLVAAIMGLDRPTAGLVVWAGALWLGGRVMLDPAAPLPAGRFRLNLPFCRPGISYEIDPARVVLEDPDLIVYHKEAARPSQGVPHDFRNNVLAAMERRAGFGLRLPHRLDAPTSGLLLMAANRQAASRLGKGFQEGRVSKRYLALARGAPPSWRELEVDVPIGKSGPSRYAALPGGPGRDSRTRLAYLGERGGYLLFLAEPLTGRTHQIRLHLAHAGYPVAGDDFYGGARDRRLMLRASGLRLAHPGDGRPLVLGGPWPEAGAAVAPRPDRGD